MAMWPEPLADTKLQALLAAVRRSPICLRPIARLTLAAREWLPIVRSPLATVEWLKVRKSGHADAFVLAWIASHARDRRRARRVLM